MGSFDWNTLGRFIVGSYLWDKFYPNNAAAGTSSVTSTIDKGLVLVRLIIIVVVGWVVYSFFRKRK